MNPPAPQGLVHCLACGTQNWAGAEVCAGCHGRLVAGPLPAVRFQQAGPGAVRITGVDIGIGDLMMLMIKAAIASIPAAIILLVLGTVLSAIVTVLLAGLGAAVGASF